MEEPGLFVAGLFGELGQDASLGGFGLLEIGLEVGDGLEEVASLDDHDEVNGVEVALAAEAAAEIGTWIGGRIELFTDWTEEAEDAFASFAGPAEATVNQSVDRDLVA
jgi:hypothetical protein